jgi:hypothetical protein
LNADAAANIFSKLVTPLTSHPETSVLNEVAAWNVARRLIPLDIVGTSVADAVRLDAA